MGRTCLVHYAAPLVLALPSIAPAAPTSIPTGKDLLEICTEREASFCEGYASAMYALTGDRFLKRLCPPAITNDPHWRAKAVIAYFRRHPNAVRMSAPNVVFEAETDALEAQGLECRKKK